MESGDAGRRGADVTLGDDAGVVVGVDDWLAVRDDVAEFDSVTDSDCEVVAVFDVDAVAVEVAVEELLSD